MFSLCALCLAGDLEYVEKLAAQDAEQVDRGSDRFANGLCLEFLANPLSPAAEKKLLREGTRNGYAAINTHFTIAMTRLAARDREKAIEHLKACTDTVAVGNLSYEMARAFLIRMEADPNWPGWLQDNAAD
jgi:hypothetical protein